MISYSFDPSLLLFSQFPNLYYLTQDGQTIKAVERSLHTPEELRVHAAALKVLDTVSTPGYPGTISAHNIALVNQCKQADFIYKIDKWASESPPSENRAEAARRIIKTYTENLNFLFLFKLNLSSIPDEIFKLKQLTSLNVSKNKLSVLSDKIGDLTDLEYLNLGQNLITVLPNTITLLTQLKEFYLTPMPDGNIIAANPFLANAPAVAFVRMQSPGCFEEACRINGLVLEFISKKQQTTALIAIAIHQNRDSIAFADPRILDSAKHLLSTTPDPSTITGWNDRLHVWESVPILTAR